MNYVEPIRDINKVMDIENYLKKKDDKYYIMFELGIYTGLRISDILKLKVKDVKNKNSISIKEQKTRKQKVFGINPLLKKELKWYCEDKDGEEYLIKSREGYNKSISREMAYKVIKAAGIEVGIYDLGTHSLRKTFGYHFYMKYKDIVLLQKIFNHVDPSITLRYIGIAQDAIDEKIRDFRIY